ncbi:MAG: CvpA family protein [Devosia sp.]|uniref:CvpA family protein n=1 Tax=Devosia sp. TaxID=1871048 RepID=UPI001AC6DE13|nr:CvpA family protein [Devosia sp.]MBN9307767.1 CvpA family protein [Devosia sp.]MBN9316270.1 CvpA family protein [Devosia sp.]
MLTAFDVGVGVLVLISAILATARGFTREVLSLATWVGAAAVAAYLYFYQPTLLDQFFTEELISKIVLVAGGFLVSLIVLHLLTMRIADFVVDSRIGPLDRTLGFVFGVARGVLISVVVVIFGLWLMSNNLPAWAKDSRSLPVLENLGNSLISLLPTDLEKQVTDLLHRGKGGTEDGSPDEAPAPGEAPPPDDSTDLPEDATPQDAAPATNT